MEEYIYQDYAHVDENDEEHLPPVNDRKRTHSDSFPLKLYRILSTMEAEGLDDVMSWLPHGRAFAVHDKKRFQREVSVR